MLDSFRKGQRWLVMLIIAFVGVVFVFYLGGGGSAVQDSPSGSFVVELGDIQIAVPDYMRARAQQEQQMSESFGDQFDARKLASFLDAQTLQSLISGAILADSANALGFRVSKQEIQAIVRDSGGFRNAEGLFDPKLFKDFADYEYGNERNFIRTMRQDVLRQKMVQLLWGQARVTEAEARAAALHRLQQARLAFVALDTEALPPGEAVDEELAQAHLEAERENLVAVYEERAAEFKTEDQVHAWHLLISAVRGVDEDTVDARQRAESALERIQGGEPFEEVARGVSEDPGTVESGGDLGVIARGEIAPELEAVAFELAVDEPSAILQSDSGFHIVRITERIPGGVRPFDDVAMDLAREAAAKKAAGSRATKLADAIAEAVRNGRGLEEAAGMEGVTVERTVLFRRRADGYIPGLGGSQDAMATAFSLSADAPRSSTIFEVGKKLVLIELLERPELDATELENAVEGEKTRLLNAKRNQILDNWVNTQRDELVNSGRLFVNADLVVGS